MFDWSVAVFLFFSYMAIDALYALWMLSVTQKRPLRAGLVAAATMCLIVLTTISFTKSAVYAIPVALGSGIGTSIMTWHAGRKNSD